MRVRLMSVAVLAMQLAALPGQSGPATVRGAVLDQSGKPATGVAVVVFPADESQWSSAVARGAMQRVSMVNGSYTVAGLPAGNYKAAVAAEGAVKAFPDVAVIKELAASGLPFVLAPGEQVTLNFYVNVSDAGVSLATASVSRLQTMASGRSRGAPPGAVLRPEGAPSAAGAISGVVTGADGQPLSGVTMAALRRLSRPGMSVPVPTRMGQSVVTDGAGKYRLSGLGPGLFLVAALATPIDVTSPGLATLPKLPRLAAAADGTRVGYVTTYYPGVAALAGAQAVSLMNNELSGVDFRMATLPVVELSGQVAALIAQPMLGLLVTLLPEDVADHLGGHNVQRAVVASDGRFSFDQVALGRYVITVNAGPRGWAKVAVDITGPRERPIGVELQRPLSLTGRVELAGATDGATLPMPAGLGVALEARPLVSGSTRPMSAVAPDGTFTIRDIPAGGYALRISGTTTLTQVAGLIQGQDTLDAPVEITADVTGAAVVLASRPSNVLVTVRDDLGQPVGNIVGVLFSDDKTYWSLPSRRLQVLRVGPSGTFTVTNLPPGKYFVAAGRDIPINPQISPAWLSSLLPRATTFEIGIGADKTLQVQLKSSVD